MFLLGKKGFENISGQVRCLTVPELYTTVFINFEVLIYLEYCFRIRLRSERTKKEVNKEVKDQSNDQMKEKCTKGRS